MITKHIFFPFVPPYKMSVKIEADLAGAMNCMEHDFTLYDESGTKVILTIPPSGVVLRAGVISQPSAVVAVGEAGDASVLIGLPQRGEVTPEVPAYPIIVSEVAARAILHHRGPGQPIEHPIWVPNTSPGSVVRGAAGGPESGKILGVRGVFLAAPDAAEFL